MEYLIPQRHNKYFKTNIYKDIVTRKELNEAERVFLIYISNWINYNYNRDKKCYTEISYTHICEELGWTRHKTSRTIKSLRKMGYLYTDRDGKRQKYYVIADKWETSVDSVTNIGYDSDTEQKFSVDSVTNLNKTSVDSVTNQKNIGVDSVTKTSVDSVTNRPQNEPVQVGDSDPPNLEIKFKEKTLEFRDNNKFKDVTSTSTRTRTEKLNKILKMYYLKRQRYDDDKWVLLSNAIEEIYGIPNLKAVIEVQSGGITYHAMKITMFILFSLSNKYIHNPKRYVHKLISSYTASSYDSIRKQIEYNTNVKYIDFRRKFSNIYKNLQKQTSAFQIKKYYSKLDKEKQDKLQTESEEETKKLYETMGKDYTKQLQPFQQYTKNLINKSKLNQKIMKEILNG
jgi:DNA-binding MarR family transcriptional regulator